MTTHKGQQQELLGILGLPKPIDHSRRQAANHRSASPAHLKCCSQPYCTTVRSNQSSTIHQPWGKPCWLWCWSTVNGVINKTMITIHQHSTLLTNVVVDWWKVIFINANVMVDEKSGSGQFGWRLPSKAMANKGLNWTALLYIFRTIWLDGHWVGGYSKVHQPCWVQQSPQNIGQLSSSITIHFTLLSILTHYSVKQYWSTITITIHFNYYSSI